MILQPDGRTDRWTDGQTDSQPAAPAPRQPAAGCEQHPAPHRLVVMRRPLTKVVEVETERKPSPASAPELKDEAKKSAKRSHGVSARGGSGHTGTNRALPRREQHQEPVIPLPEEPGNAEKKWPPPWCRWPAPRSSEKGSISSARQGAPRQQQPPDPTASNRPRAPQPPQDPSPGPCSPPTPHAPKKSAKGSRPPKNSRKTSWALRKVKVNSGAPASALEPPGPAAGKRHRVKWGPPGGWELQGVQ